MSRDDSAETRIGALFARFVEAKSGVSPDTRELAELEATAMQELLEGLAVLRRIKSVVGDATPSSLGDFDLIREIGRGGMGIVFEARQRSLDRRVAVKVLPPHPSVDATAIARFEREARTAASLEHEGIVDVYSVGQDGDVRFFAMELIEGRSLDRLIEGPSRTPPATVLDIGIQIADALAHAHSRGVIHRDVKPSNILVRPNGRVVLTDFGLAREMASPGLTQAGAFAGTPFYVSPEQIRARARVDARTDVFSLGVTLYELLTGERAFAGTTTHEVLQAIVTRDPVDPQCRTPDLSPELCAIVMKALEKRPEDRYESAQRFGDDLRAFRDYRPVTARRPGMTRRIHKWIRRRPAVASLSFAATLIAGLGFYALAKQDEIAAGHVALRRQRYESRLAQSYGELYEGAPRTALKDFAKLRAETDDPFAVLGQVLALRRLKRDAEALALAKSANAPHLVSWLSERRSGKRGTQKIQRFATTAIGQFTAGMIEFDLSHHGSEKRGLERAFRHFREACLLAPNPREALATQLLHTAAHLGSTNRIQMAIRVCDAHWPKSAEVMMWKSLALLSLDLPEAIRCGRAAVAARPTESLPAVLLANALRRSGKAGARDAVQLLEPHARTKANAARGYCDALWMLGRFEEIVRHCESMSPDQLEHSHLNVRLGHSLFRLERFDELEQLARRMLKHNADSPYGIAFLADVHRNRGDEERAHKGYERAWKLDPKNADLSAGAGWGYLQRRDWAKAERAMRNYVAAAAHDRAGHFQLALALAGLGRYADAVASYRTAIEWSTKYGQDYPEAECNLGFALLQLQRPSDALVHLRRGHELGSKRPQWTLPSAQWIAEAERAEERQRKRR